MKVFFKFFLILIVFAASAGCKKPGNEPTPEKSPLSPLAAPTWNSPLGPLNTDLPAFPGERFRLDTPLIAGTQKVSGQGPVNIPLQVVDITTGGEVMGNGKINDDGHFTISLGIPVPANHVIGIRLATAKDPNTWLSLWALRGENARAIPQIGDFFDTVISSSK